MKDVSFGVGDIVRPKRGYSFGYCLNRFYRVEKVEDEYFWGVPLCSDFSPLGNVCEKLKKFVFLPYRRVYHAKDILRVGDIVRFGSYICKVFGFADGMSRVICVDCNTSVEHVFPCQLLRRVK